MTKAVDRRAHVDMDTPLRCFVCGREGDGRRTLLRRMAEENTSKPRGADPPHAPLEPAAAYRASFVSFMAGTRTILVSETRNHEPSMQHTAMSALTSDVVVLVVDADWGLLEQARLHAYVSSLLRVRHLVLAINKMDLVGYSRDAYRAIAREFDAFAGPLDFVTSVCVPISAKFDENVHDASDKTPWYEGPSLLAHLGNLSVDDGRQGRPFRLPVAQVQRPHLAPPALSGTISAGRVAKGDSLLAAKTGRASRVRRIVTRDGNQPAAVAGETVTLGLEDDVDVAPGDLLVAPTARPEVSDQFAAHIVWVAEEELLPGRLYLLTCGTKTVPAQVTSIKHRVDIQTLEHLAAKTLGSDEVGIVNVALAESIAFDPFSDNRDTGGFILYDRFTQCPVAVGAIDFGLRRASNVHWQALDVDPAARADMKGQRPVVLWFTGLSGSGKSTIANLVERTLARRGRHTYMLDGDNVRHGLNRDLGFTDADRVENIRRVAEVAKLFVDAGLIVLVSFISPFRSERDMARHLVKDGQFVEIFVDTPIEVCAARDPKGLYKKAKAGEIKNFTGLDSAYERPEKAEITLKTAGNEAADLALAVVRHLERHGYVPEA